jgi:predicted ribosomally synthesized peptide with SipW-like signal peptide
MRTKKFGIALLVMLAFVVTTGTFAYWASSVNGPANDTTVGTVTVGSGEAVVTSFTLGSTNATGGDLVPANQLANSAAGAVDNVVVTYTVEWNEDTAVSQLDGTTSTAPLTVTPVVTLVDENSNNVTDASVLALISVTPSGSNASSLTLDGGAESLSWTITMSEPADQAEYDLIANGTITITFTYSLGTITTSDNS